MQGARLAITSEGRSWLARQADAQGLVVMTYEDFVSLHGVPVESVALEG